MIPLFLHFDDEAAALSAILPLLGTFDPPLDGIPRDGEIDAVHVDMDVLFGNGHLPDTPGFHVNVLWAGPEDLVPVIWQAARVYPSTPACVFG